MFFITREETQCVGFGLCKTISVVLSMLTISLFSFDHLEFAIFLATDFAVFTYESNYYHQHISVISSKYQEFKTL
jgi:hypothetical protein